MATYKVPYQNLEFNIPDTGQVFRYPNDPYAVYVREGNTIKAYSLMALGGGQKAGEHASVSESKGREILKSKYGLDFESLPTFSGADAQTALGGATAGDWGAFNPTTPTSTGEVITKSISPINPQGADITSSLTGAISKSPSIQENLARAGATPEQQAQIAAGTQIGQPTQISPELKAQITPEAKPITTPATSQWQTPEQRTAVEKATGAPIPKTPTYAPGTPTALIGQTDQQANADMQKDLATINAQAPTGTTDYNKMFASVVSLLSEQKPPTAPSMVTTGKQLLADLNVGTLEGDLAANDVRRAQLDASWQTTELEEGGRLVSMAQIRKRQSALGIEYQRQKGELEVERARIVGQLNMKYNTVEMMMKWTGQDYETASKEYQNKITNAINLTNLIKGISDSQKTDQERLTDNARANGQIIIDLIKGGNINPDTVPESTKLEWNNIELQAGWPKGFLSLVSKTVTETISNIDSYTNADGQRVNSIMTKNADGSYKVTEIVGGDVETKPTKATIDAGISSIITGLEKTKGKDGFYDPDKYVAARKAFQAEYPDANIGDLDKAVADMFSPAALVRLRTVYGLTLGGNV